MPQFQLPDYARPSRSVPRKRVEEEDEFRLPNYATPAKRKQFEEEDELAEAAQTRAEDNSTSWLGKAYEIGDKSAFDYLPENLQKYRPKELYKKATSGIRKYGESVTGKDPIQDKIKQAVRYRQAIGETITGTAEEFANPINAALMALSGGSSVLFKLAKGSKDFQTAQKLYQGAKALEFPGRVASGGQVAHGSYKVATDDTTEGKLAAVAEMGLGIAGLRYRNNPPREYPKPTIKNVTPPKKGSSTPPPSAPIVPPVAPVTTPTPFNASKLTTIHQYLDDLKTGKIPSDTKFNDYTPPSSVIPEVTKPLTDPEIKDITDQNKPVSFDELSPELPIKIEPQGNLEKIGETALKPGAKYAFLQPGFEDIPDFHMYNVPVEGGGMTTVDAEQVVKMGYELPPITEAMQRPESLPATNELLPDVRQPKPGKRFADDGIRIGSMDEDIVTVAARRKAEGRETLLPPEMQLEKLAKAELYYGKDSIQYKQLANEIQANGVQLPDVRQNQINEQLSENPPIIDDQGGMDWIPEPNQPEPVDPAKLQQFLGEVQSEVGLPSVRQEPTGQLEQIGAQLTRGEQWQEIVDELDARKASDREYRDILSTGGKDPLKKKETWRGRVQQYIKMDAELEAQKQAEREQAEIDTGNDRPSEMANRRPKNAMGYNPMRPDLGPHDSGFNKFSIAKDLSEADTSQNVRAKALGITQEQMKDLNPEERSKLIYDTIQKKKAELDSVPPEEFDKPSNMRVKGSARKNNTELDNIAIGPEMEDTRLLDIVATALYRRDRPSVVAKELIQNSADEMKISGHMGPIRIAFNDSATNPVTGNSGRSVTVQDPGRGMNDTELYTYFTNIGETGKGNVSDASGGFGVAKAAPLLGAEYVQIISIHKGKDGNISKYTFAGSPSDLKKQKIGVSLKREYVPLDTTTGFQVEAFFNDDKGLDAAKGLTVETVRNSPYLKGVQIFKSYSNYKVRDFLQGKPTPDAEIINGEVIPPLVHTITNPGSVIEIHYELDDIERKGGTMVYLNNDLYAMQNSLGYSFMPIPHVPARVVANVKATVEEGEEGYPYTMNREALNDDIVQVIKDWVNKEIVDPAQARGKSELQRVYDELVPASGNDFVVLDSGERYTSDELNRLNSSPVIKNIAVMMKMILDELAHQFSSNILGVTTKYGFTISTPSAGGINVPSPKETRQTGMKYAIMVNPFGAAIQSTTPKIMAQRLVHIIAHEFTHNMVRSEGGQYTWALAKVLSEWDGDSQMEYRDEILKAVTDPATGDYLPEFQELLQEYTESRRRPESKVDTLTRQREVEWARQSKGQEGAAGSSGDDGEGITGGNSKRRDRSKPRPEVERDSPEVIGESVARLKEALVQGKLARQVQDAGYHEERVRRAGRISGVKTRGQAGYYQKLGMLQGPLPKVESQTSILADEDVDILIDAITDSELLLPFQEIAAGEGLFKLLNGQAPQPSEMKLLEQVFGGDGELTGLVELHGGIGVPGGITKALVYDIASVAKTMKSAGDLSGALRQGLPFVGTKAYTSAFLNMHKYLGSQASYDASMASIAEHPDYDLLMESGAFMAEFGTKNLAKREENMMSSMLDNTWGFKHSQRAYTGFLNELRAKTVYSLIDTARNMPVVEGQEPIRLYTRDEKGRRVATPALHEIGRYVNVFTGRGGLGDFEKNAVMLNTFFWSPRNVSSRFTILNPFYYVNASPFVRKQAVHSLLRIAAVGMGTLGLAKYVLDAEVNYTDPTSADFMKAKWGNNRLDGWAGLQQNTVAEIRILKYFQNAALLLSGKPIPKNQKYRPGSGYNYNTGRDVILNYGENKLSPLASFASAILDIGKSYEPGGAAEHLTKENNYFGLARGRALSDNRITREVINMFSPMLIDTILDLAKEDPGLLPGIPLAVLATYGQSVQTYSNDRVKGGQYMPRPSRLLP